MQVKPTAFLKPSIRSIQYGMAETPATHVAPAVHAACHFTLAWKLSSADMPSDAAHRCGAWYGLCEEALAQEGAGHHAREGLMVIGCKIAPVL